MPKFNQAKTTERYISPIERIFLALHRAMTPYAIELVIEGSGELSPHKIQEAIAQASRVNPGVRVVLCGSLSQTRWVETPNAPPFKMNAHEYEDHFKEVALFPQEKSNLSVDQGPICDIALFAGSTTKLVIRALHAAMDGQGILHFLREIFRALNGDSLLGSTLHPSDEYVTKVYGHSFIRSTVPQYKSPTGPPSGAERLRFVRRRVTLEGNYPAMTAQLAAILAEESYLRGASRANFLVPVDLRARVTDVRSVGCLVSFLNLHVHKGDSWRKIYGEILKAFQQKEDCLYGESDHIVKMLPLALIEWILKMQWKSYLKKNRYICTGLISNLGKVELRDFTTSGFVPQTIYSIPVQNINVPVMVVAVEHEGFVEMSLSMPELFADDHRIDQLIDALKRQLQRGRTAGK